MEMAIKTVLGFLGSSIMKSKGGEQANDELSKAIWEWIRPIFLKDPETINDFQENPTDLDNVNSVAIKVKKAGKNNQNIEDEILEFARIINSDKSLADEANKFMVNNYRNGTVFLGNKAGRDQYNANTMNFGNKE